MLCVRFQVDILIGKHVKTVVSWNNEPLQKTIIFASTVQLLCESKNSCKESGFLNPTHVIKIKSKSHIFLKN